MGKLKYAWDHLEETIAAVTLFIMAMINFVNVVGRFVFNHPFSWGDESLLMLFLWATMMGAATAFKKGLHFNMGLLAESGSRIRHIVLAMLVLIFNVLFGFLVLITGIKMVGNQIKFHGIIPSLHISQAYQGLAIPVGAILMIIRSIENAINTIRNEKETE